MKKKEIVKYIREVTWDDVKDLPHVQHRIYFNKKLELQDVEIEKSSYLYITIFNSADEEGRDRYFGSHTDSKTKSFMETEYLGSPVKNLVEFNKALREKEHRIICIKLGDDEGSILNEEQEVLVTVDAKENPKFFNESNISGGKRKTLTKQIKLFKLITTTIEKANQGVDCDFEIGEDTLDNLYAMPRSQPRQFDLDKKLVTALIKVIKGTYGKALDSMRLTILLKNYHGLGKHRRGGNTHTLEASMKPSAKKFVTKLFKTIFIPEELWKQCTEDTLRDILRWDNSNQDELPRKVTDNLEIAQSCFAMMVEYDLEHTDVRVKERALELGALDDSWDKIRPKLREWAAAKESLDALPPNMELIHYTDGDLKKIEAAGSNDGVDLLVITTVYSGGNFQWDTLVRWLNDPKNKGRTCHGMFFFGKESHNKYELQWATRQLDIIPIIHNMFKLYGGHFTYGYLPRFQPKQNKVLENE